nr:ATP-binding protein [uncultured Undibacterium sp.]
MHPPHLKLGSRLALSYGVVIALLVGVALAGLVALAELSHTTDDAFKDKYPKTILVNKLINNLETIARAMRNTLFLNDEQQVQEQLQEINATNIQMASALATLKKNVTDVQSVEIIRDIEIVHSAYIVNQEDFIKLVTNNRMGEAKNLLLVDLHPYQIQYFHFLNMLNRHQSELMDKASSDTSKTFLVAKRLMLILTVLTVVLSIFVTIYISRSLLKQLGGEPSYAAAVANKIALGDLSSKIQIKVEDHSSLLYVMERMRESLLERSEALESSNMELEAMVDTLKQTQEDLVLSQKMAALGSLVAGIAHELNTPLGNGLMAASTLADMTQSMCDDVKSGIVKRSTLEIYFARALEGQEMLIRNLNRASELVRSFKQVAADPETSQLTSFILGDVVQEAMLNLQPLLNNTDFAVVIDVSPDIVLESYPGPLAQVLTNLLSNALIHGLENRLKGKLLVSAGRISGQLIELVIADDGVGIEPKNLTRIFDPFFTTKLGHGASGLGLHIVHNIVHTVLQGKIKVSSELGVGTKFVLTLPERVFVS